jgi:hypothetical protein
MISGRGFCVAVIATICGCASGGPTAPPATADVSGTWAATAHASERSGAVRWGVEGRPAPGTGFPGRCGSARRASGISPLEMSTRLRR